MTTGTTNSAVRTPPNLVVQHTLTDEEANEAFQLAAICAKEYSSIADATFLAEASVIAHDLPRRVRSAVNDARLNDRKHALLIGNNMIAAADALEPTPRHWRDADTEGSRPAAFLAMLYGALLGDSVGWANQQEGRLVTDVLPIPGMEESLLSSSSNKVLGWHTEDAFSPARGDYVGLFCLRNPDLTPTTLSYVDVDWLDDEVVSVLSERRFHTRPDHSHVTGNGSSTIGRQRTEPDRVSVLDGARDAAVLRVDRDFTVAVDGDHVAAAALRIVVEHIDANLYPVPLAPGDMCFVDNRNVVHGRSAFRPRYDGTDRWLKRVNIAADLRRTRPARRSSDTRVIG
jgi:Fe(II)/alpha-ketoglutarate-dependent arginine beta-hydroxylase